MSVERADVDPIGHPRISVNQQPQSSPLRSADNDAREQPLLRLRDGDHRAADVLLEMIFADFQKVVRRMLFGFPVVRRWEDTDDIWQEAALKLHKALIHAPPTSQLHRYRLGALQIRRVLIQYLRRHTGPQGFAANHDTRGLGDSKLWRKTQDHTDDPLSLADWGEFHEQVESLPEVAKEAFDLLWYAGLSFSEAAKIWNITEGSVRRRWLSAQVKLGELRQGDPPG